MTVMNTAIEMHDSVCLAVELDGCGRGSVLLDAYVHRTEGKTGRAAGEGGVQRIRVSVEGMTVDGEVRDLPANIYQGSFTIGESTQDNIVPFPATYSESISLSMILSDDARVVTVSGTRAALEAEGEFRFVELVDFSGC
jgi:hypothetical protein